MHQRTPSGQPGAYPDLNNVPTYTEPPLVTGQVWRVRVREGESIFVRSLTAFQYPDIHALEPGREDMRTREDYYGQTPSLHQSGHHHAATSSLMQQQLEALSGKPSTVRVARSDARAPHPPPPFLPCVSHGFVHSPRSLLRSPVPCRWAKWCTPA